MTWVPSDHRPAPAPAPIRMPAPSPAGGVPSGSLEPFATPSPPRYRPATFSDVLRSEWTKFRTVRASFWCVLVAVILGIGISILVSGISAHHYSTDASVRSGWNPTDNSLSGFALAQFAFGVLGVMTITNEYSTGLIRTTLASVPRRGRLLVAKASMFTVVALVTGLVISFVSFLAGQALISGNAPSASLGQHEVLRVVIGAGLYMALLALFGLALGSLFRNVAAGIVVLVFILLILPLVAHALPTSWERPIVKYWPTNAGSQLAQMARDSHTLTPWLGFLDMTVFVAVLLGVAYLLLERRDA